MTTEERNSLLHGMQCGDLAESALSHGEGCYAGNTMPIPRLGVPALKMQDAACGFRPPRDAIGTSTCFPSMLALSSTWDTSLVKAYAKSVAEEFRGKGANVFLGPAINVHRTAYGGRNYEYLSGEDPHLGAVLTRAFVQAVQNEGVMAVAKHFAFNEQETGRMYNDAWVDKRTAWELYYPPWEAAVEAGVSAVMCSYNRVNGSYACASHEILQRDLKGTMGFHGFVVSDWWAVHGKDFVTNGLDLEMPNAKYLSDDRLASLPRDSVDAAALRVLATIYRLRLDEMPGCTPGGQDCAAEMRSNQASKEHRAVARSVATSAVTLLKNDGTLPFDKSDKKARYTIAIVGVAANQRGDSSPSGEFMADYYSGGGSGHCQSSSLVTPLDGIKQRAISAGISVLASTSNNITHAFEVAQIADVVVVIAAATSTEGVDRFSLALDDNVDDLIFAVAKIRPTVVLMQTPGAVLTPWRDNVAAIANLFLPGEEAGSAWAAMLFGDVSPAGKLPIVFPASIADTVGPDFSIEMPYSEGQKTSYRSASIRAAFPFGHGLAYTRFELSKPIVMTAGCHAIICIRIMISNVGERPGTEVAQAYLEFPPPAGMPSRVLRGFHKTSLLQPGQSEQVEFALSTRDMSSYQDNTGWVKWDNIQMHIGVSSADIRHVIALAPGAIPVLFQTKHRLRSRRAQDSL